MINPNNSGSCSDSQGEYVEVVYTSQASESIDLRGLLLADESRSEYIRSHTVLSQGGRMDLRRRRKLLWQCQCAAWKNSFSLNNGGDSLSLFHDDIDGQKIQFDQLTYTGDWVETGVAIQPVRRQTAATDNDDLNNWCWQPQTSAPPPTLEAPVRATLFVSELAEHPIPSSGDASMS